MKERDRKGRDGDKPQTERESSSYFIENRSLTLLITVLHRQFKMALTSTLGNEQANERKLEIVCYHAHLHEIYISPLAAFICWLACQNKTTNIRHILHT